jgi:hypothetical protein
MNDNGREKRSYWWRAISGSNYTFCYDPQSYERELSDMRKSLENKKDFFLRKVDKAEFIGF